jgi:hypothetical protein
MKVVRILFLSMLTIASFRSQPLFIDDQWADEKEWERRWEGYDKGDKPPAEFAAFGATTDRPYYIPIPPTQSEWYSFIDQTTGLWKDGTELYSIRQ